MDWSELNGVKWVNFLVSIRDLFLKDFWLIFCVSYQLRELETGERLRSWESCYAVGWSDWMILKSCNPNGRRFKVSKLNSTWSGIHEPLAKCLCIYMVINQRYGHKHYIVFLDTMRTIFNGHQIHDSYGPSFIHHDSLEVHIRLIDGLVHLPKQLQPLVVSQSRQENSKNDETWRKPAWFLIKFIPKFTSNTVKWDKHGPWFRLDFFSKITITELYPGRNHKHSLPIYIFVLQFVINAMS